jgi:release factor glutamine methyltransferase
VTPAASPQTVGALLARARVAFQRSGSASPALDARLLVGHVLERDAAALISGEHDRVPGARIARAEALIARRVAGEPVARILGRAEFYGLEIVLGPQTLVPRPETELLVDIGIEKMGKKAARFADLGTGSGAIAVALAVHCPRAGGIASDISAQALAVAGRNAAAHEVAQRLQFIESDWFGAYDDTAPFDLIVANPPYIATGEIEGLEVAVARFDPLTALDGGPGGLAAYAPIIQGALKRLSTGGTLALEVGAGQAGAVAALLAGSGFSGTRTQPDLAGHDRVVSACRRDH